MGTRELRRDGWRAVRSLTTAVTLSSIAALGGLSIGTFSGIEASFKAAATRHPVPTSRPTTVRGPASAPSPSPQHRPRSTPAQAVTHAPAPHANTAPSMRSARPTTAPAHVAPKASTPVRRKIVAPPKPAAPAPKPVVPVTAGSGAPRTTSSGS